MPISQRCTNSQVGRVPRKREIDPAVAAIHDVLKAAEGDTTVSKVARARLQEMQNFVTTLDGWFTQMTAVSPALYAATNDGLLHAFWADETKKENNEMWAMLLPAAMTHVLSTYPSSHEFLLDGSPIVKDVVWDRNLSSTCSSAPSASLPARVTRRLRWMSPTSALGKASRCG